MKKIALTLLLLLNVTNSAVFADCVTGYACSVKDLNKDNTNSVMMENSERNNLSSESKKVENERKEKIEKEKLKIQENEIKNSAKSQI